MVSGNATLGGGVIAGEEPGSKSKTKLSWKDFKATPYESKKDFSKEVERIAVDNFDKHINLANYIIEEP